MNVHALKNGALSLVLAHILILSTTNSLQAADPSTSTTKKDSPSTDTSSSTDKKKEEKKDEAKPAKTEEAVEVVVTATRTETPIDKTASSISVISQEEIQKGQYTRLSDVLSTVPGIPVVSTGATGQATQVYIRGLKSNHTAVFIDGRRAPQYYDGTYDLANIDLSNVERVEVVRGSSSVLYGADAMAGAINIITKKGRGLDKPVTSAWFEGGSFSSFREGASTRGKEGAFDYSVEGSHFDTQNQRKNNDYTINNYRGNFGYEVNKDMYASLLSSYSYTSEGLPGDAFTNNPISDMQDENIFISPSYEWQTTEIWKQNFSFTFSKQRNVFNNPITLGNDTEGYQRTSINNKEFAYQSDIQALDNLLVTAGLNIADQETNFMTSVPGWGAYADTVSTRSSQGGYLQTQWEILPDWNLINGVRYDFYSDCSNAFTYKAGSSYRTPVTRTLLHANYGTSYRPPNVSDENPAYYLPSTGIKPEENASWEAGVEQPFFGDKLKLGATYFENNLTNLINYRTVGFFSQPYNIDKAFTRGIETNASYKINEWVSVSANHTWIETENKQTGARLARVPRNMINANIIVQPIKALTLTLGTTWMFDRTDYIPAPPPAWGSNGSAEDYFTARFTVAYDINDHLQIFGRIENLTNEQYSEAAGYPALDRGLYGGFKLTF